ncbi:hypothetical protein CAMRE0001_0676 [Campylobacter rectus RM3267]|uniref:Uncharacterized protein n=1 Tax=Campylobacter rectus RM3267 TaxID=553218 RepID=B9D1L2_CAMRE|nr:hypothetical protein CAMRE0001_0676 [Campylobacter rectus RM3267]
MGLYLQMRQLSLRLLSLGLGVFVENVFLKFVKYGDNFAFIEFCFLEKCLYRA